MTMTYEEYMDERGILVKRAWEQSNEIFTKESLNSFRKIQSYNFFAPFNSKAEVVSQISSIVISPIRYSFAAIVYAASSLIFATKAIVDLVKFEPNKSLSDIKASSNLAVSSSAIILFAVLQSFFKCFRPINKRY